MSEKFIEFIPTICLVTGLCAGESISVHFDASGVILNHNFTKEFYMEDTKDCETCQTLAANITTGVSYCHMAGVAVFLVAYCYVISSLAFLG